MASVVSSGIGDKIDRKVANMLCEKFDRLENCAVLVVPKTNKELWLPPTMRKTLNKIDNSFQIKQKYLHQWLIPLVTLMGILLNTDRNAEVSVGTECFSVVYVCTKRYLQP